MPTCTIHLSPKVEQGVVDQWDQWDHQWYQWFRECAGLNHEGAKGTKDTKNGWLLPEVCVGGWTSDILCSSPFPVWALWERGGVVSCFSCFSCVS